MAEWSSNSLRAGKKMRDSVGGDQTLSKIVELNGQYRLFFKTFVEIEEVKDDAGNVVSTERYGNIRAAVVPGRTGNYDMVGTSFIPYTEDMYKKDPITGEPVDLTPLNDWARIGRVLFEAACAREKKNAEAEAQRSAEEMGRQVDPVSLNRSLEAIELKYHGGESAKGDKIMPDESPALSSNIQFKISTRIAVVKMNAANVPDWKNAKYAVLDNPAYFNMDSGYLEVGYSYIGEDKKVAGKNAKFQGIASTLSLATTFPAEWASIGEKFVENIATGTPEDQVNFIRSRNRAFKSGKTPNDAIASFRKYCSTNQAIFGSINFEDDYVVRSAKIFLDSHLVDTMPKQLAEFQRLAEEQAKKRNDGGEGESSATAEEVASETTGSSATTETSTYDAAATADAVAKFGSGDASTQTLREIAATEGVDISEGDLGDLGGL